MFLPALLSDEILKNIFLSEKARELLISYEKERFQVNTQFKLHVNCISSVGTAVMAFSLANNAA